MGGDVRNQGRFSSHLHFVGAFLARHQFVATLTDLVPRFGDLVCAGGRCWGAAFARGARSRDGNGLKPDSFYRIFFGDAPE
jgi:hypothetical protein